MSVDGDRPRFGMRTTVRFFGVHVPSVELELYLDSNCSRHETV